MCALHTYHRTGLTEVHTAGANGTCCAGRHVSAVHCSMNGALTIGRLQGFPRADVDVYKVRQLRQEHIMLSNDLKGLMSELHGALTAVHESARKAGLTQEGSAQHEAQMSEPSGVAAADGSAGASKGLQAAQQPFARISAVEAGSPAHTAGMHEGDEVCRFRDVTAGPGALQAIAARLAVCFSAATCAMRTSLTLKSQLLAATIASAYNAGHVQMTLMRATICIQRNNVSYIKTVGACHIGIHLTAGIRMCRDGRTPHVKLRCSERMDNGPFI